VQAPTLDDGEHIGVALQYIREFYGLSIEDLVRATRIRRHYLQSIEVLRLDQLPSRPFTIGYVRAYAVALGQDGERAVARFRHDAPDPNEPLRAPVGVRREGDPRLTLVAVSCVVVVGGILVWNLVERARSAGAPRPPAVAAAAAKTSAAPAPQQGPVTLGAPLPPPQESTTPQPYVTPGLEGQMSDGDAVASGAAADMQATAAGAEQALPVGAPFEAKGEVFGDPKLADAVILQARKPVSITLRRPDGSIAQARFLAEGQALRAPAVKGWMVEVPVPAALDVYVGGVLKGPLAVSPTSVADLAKPADAGQ
jgi:cytoskeletal protein RodZ